jgi:hypothetical protein
LRRRLGHIAERDLDDVNHSCYGQFVDKGLNLVQGTGSRSGLRHMSKLVQLCG